MMYVIRVKAVSECMGIRRASLCYLFYKNQKVDLTKMPHPIRKFKELMITEDLIEINSKKEKLLLGEEVFFANHTKVDAGNKVETERAVLGAMLIPLDEAMVSYYEDSIEKGYTFDQWNGEFEYLLGLMYEYDNKNDKRAEYWYQRAIDKNFRFKLLEE